MVGRRLDRLAVDPEVFDLLVGVDEDGADGVLGDRACGEIAGGDSSDARAVAPTVLLPYKPRRLEHVIDYGDLWS